MNRLVVTCHKNIIYNVLVGVSRQEKGQIKWVSWTLKALNLKNKIQAPGGGIIEKFINDIFLCNQITNGSDITLPSGLLTELNTMFLSMDLQTEITLIISVNLKISEAGIKTVKSELAFFGS